MEWRDEGVLLATRPHGESSAIIEVLTASHGRHLGVVRGGASRRMAPNLQPGTQLAVTWRARLDEHIGAFSVEPVRSRAAVLEDPLALAGLTSVCALLHLTLPERDPHPGLYGQTISLLDDVAKGEPWLGPYLRWELALLEEIGFGLDLSSCAVTGSREDLAYVSPRTGRAVSRQGAGDWAPKLLPLPLALMGQGPVSHAEAAQALDLTGHFLLRELSDRLPAGALPEARARLLARLRRASPDRSGAQ
ncbi:DNA repair protein RecO [Thioclava sp. FR2]|uniref:DNA repair protein RecO n=1 Tax=Thioclava sp. FR2 TaxID=3445780 RepID=UPI003EBD5329